MPEKPGQQKRSSARTNVGDIPLPSSADKPSGQRGRPGTFGRSRSSELKLELDARIALLRHKSTSFDKGVHLNSRKRAAEETLYEHNVPNKKYKSAAAMAVEKVLKTVHRGSTMAYDAFQSFKIKLTNRVTYQTAWQKDQSMTMRGCGVDFEPISGFAGGHDLGGLPPKISGKDRDNACEGNNSNETSETDYTSSFKLPKIDSENWYWVSHDLRVTVIVSSLRMFMNQYFMCVDQILY